MCIGTWPCIVTVWNLTISLAVYMLDCGIHVGYRCVCICPFTPSPPHSPVSLAPPLWLSWWMLSLYCVVVILVLLGVPLCCRLAVDGCRRRTEDEELAALQNRSWCCIGHAVKPSHLVCLDHMPEGGGAAIYPYMPREDETVLIFNSILTLLMWHGHMLTCVYTKKI